ncbi:MAG: copper amine oxidase N-terminal domain-containing protein [Clostridiales bacterium]|nr:copper amine oxidase N-terminal domain-containing protein [Clostridiales bacterium]
MPLRFAMEALGVEVIWNGDTRVITFDGAVRND